MLYVIAYWGEDEDVMWTEGDEGNEEIDTVYNAMKCYVANGHITEILEVGYYRDPDAHYRSGSISDFDVGKRCEWWRDQLRALGYKVSGR